jgi:hypothetical protein
MESTLAFDNPALRNFAIGSFSIISGAGTRPFSPSALIRWRIVRAAFPEID